MSLISMTIHVQPSFAFNGNICPVFPCGLRGGDLRVERKKSGSLTHVIDSVELL